MSRRMLYRGNALTAAVALAATFGVTHRARAQSGNGFLFGAPSGTFALRTGIAFPNTGSDLFSFVTHELTLNRSSFNTLNVAGDLSFAIAPRFDVVFSSAVGGTTSNSEFRNFTDNNNLPIEQATTFVRVPTTLSLKMYLMPRGRAVGDLAWIPSKYDTYVGVGGGAMWYRFRQEGDFIDFTNNNVFHDTFESSGFTPMAHLLAGMDYSLSPRWGLTAEGRYEFANAALSQDFSGFHRIDLSGFSLTAGFAVRF